MPGQESGKEMHEKLPSVYRASLFNLAANKIGMLRDGMQRQARLRQLHRVEAQVGTETFGCEMNSSASFSEC